jgi:hypothetical protein
LIETGWESRLILIPTPLLGGSVVNWNEHVKNRNAVPCEELLKYQDQYVAWSLDGSRILAADRDPLQLVAKLTAAGHGSDDYVLSSVSFGSDLGVGCLPEEPPEEAR